MIENARTNEPILLDLSGYPCSEALLRAGRKLRKLARGETAVLIVDCQALSDDIRSWARHTGNEISRADVPGLGKDALRVRVGTVHPRSTP